MSQIDLVHAFPLPSFLVAATGRITVANARVVDIFGGDVEGRSYVTVLRQPNVLSAIETALRQHEKREADYIRTVARRDVRYRVTCTPLGGDGEVLVVFEDRTAFEEAGQMRRDFVANVSHELKTPLTALLGFIETLRGAARDDPAARTRFLEIMDREANRMNRLVGDLLSLSKVEASARLRPGGMAELRSLSMDVIASLRPMIEASAATVDLESGETIEVPGDSDQLAQVITNLVENAVKYGGQAPTVRMSIEVSDAFPSIGIKTAVLRVRDSGVGIDPVHVPRLTERFYRIDDHRSREVGGTGLGLAIIKHVVQRHRGRLRIESNPGEGSIFSVILPMGRR